MKRVIAAKLPKVPPVRPDDHVIGVRSMRIAANQLPAGDYAYLLAHGLDVLCEHPAIPLGMRSHHHRRLLAAAQPCQASCRAAALARRTVCAATRSRSDIRDGGSH
ncbi:MAG: hypothetical protein DLM55_09955 [Acidimicrobiales bacterium]|nr:MAG: hypothetical protein DLM55_09955 [Acidimicrobiales bacterium]